MYDALTGSWFGGHSIDAVNLAPIRTPGKIAEEEITAVGMPGHSLDRGPTLFQDLRLSVGAQIRSQVLAEQLPFPCPSCPGDCASQKGEFSLVRREAWTLEL